MIEQTEKYIKIRNGLITEIVEELGEERAMKYFSLPRNRENIEEIAKYKTRIAPDRDLDINIFRKEKHAHGK